MRILMDVFIAITLFIAISVIGFMAIDALEMEKTGECKDCLVLGGWFEYLEEQGNE